MKRTINIHRYVGAGDNVFVDPNSTEVAIELNDALAHYASLITGVVFGNERQGPNGTSRPVAIILGGIAYARYGNLFKPNQLDRQPNVITSGRATLFVRKDPITGADTDEREIRYAITPGRTADAPPRKNLIEQSIFQAVDSADGPMTLAWNTLVIEADKAWMRKLREERLGADAAAVATDALPDLVVTTGAASSDPLE